MPSFFRRRLTTLNRIEIRRESIEHNFYTIKKLTAGKDIFPVLKSNAYGHGIIPIAEILRDQDFPYFAVDSYYEALQVRKIAPRKKILILGYNFPENYRYFDFTDIAVTVYDRESLEVLNKLGKKIEAHLKINTGLNRQGIAPEELADFLAIFKKSKKLVLDGVCSHFADADNSTNDFTNAQEKVFSRCIDEVLSQGFSPRFIHIANTAGMLKTKDPRINAVRPGIGLYGVNPLSTKDKYFEDFQNLKPALRLSSTLINIIELKKGEKVGYNGTFTASQHMRIGVVPVGYYECLPRALSNTGFFCAQGKSLPILGRIHMNLTCFDLKDLNLKRDDEIEIIATAKNALNSVESIAKACQTIPYEILVKLSESIRREVI